MHQPIALKTPTVDPSPEWTEGLRRTVLSWFAQYSRDFPWRSTVNPFHILLAEVLLRQTQAERVVGPYLTLISRYPEPHALADADVDSLRDWFRPLGLVKRADRLVQAAKILVKEHSGEVPQDLDILMKIPGLGHYSARAILCLAFGNPVPMIDESSGRLLRRFLELNDKGVAYSDRELLKCAERLIPRCDSIAFNLGLLDIAARYCHPSSPNCTQCPLVSICSYGQRAKAEAQGQGS